MKDNKKFIVMGLGGFGYGLATELEAQGCDVIAIDKNEERIEELADELSYLVCADIGEDDLLESIDAHDIDGVIVATSADLTAGTLATINAKEAGIGYVLAKARSEQHARVLTKVGADMVVYPEQAMGHSIAKSLASSNFADWVELSPHHSMVQQDIPAKWVGKTLAGLRLREKHGINVVGIVKGEDLETRIDPQTPLEPGITLLLIGSNDDLRDIKKL